MISARRGIEDEAPGRWTASAEAAEAQAIASGMLRPSAYAVHSAPTNVSPAAVVSTARTRTAGTVTGSAPRAAYRLPAAPSATTTSGTRSSSAPAAS
ncbi:hypothetical protein GCM10009863_10360 [Streptomyces axinellae]|uniref:Uncharacterized protein n=1 Tax=Streptomyces axinellae TaxID=552788 RepID=A0ABP6C3P7_9ACTN